MLQNNPVLNLQHESDLRIAQQTHAEPIIYSESNIISSPPRPQNNNDERKPNVSTVQYGELQSQSYIARNGLDYLYGLQYVQIEQTYELHDYSVSSENRFILRTTTNEAIFSASESSTPRDRMIWGSSRPFIMHLLDKSHQDTIIFKRKLALGILCCKPQCLEVWQSPGNLLGCVKETFSCFTTEFIIENSNGDIIFQIEGPPKLLCCCQPKDAYLNVLSADFRTLKGSITRNWSTELSTYTLNVYFNDSEMDVKHKSLFIGAAFLMEYMYFQSKSCC